MSNEFSSPPVVDQAGALLSINIGGARLPATARARRLPRIAAGAGAGRSLLLKPTGPVRYAASEVLIHSRPSRGGVRREGEMSGARDGAQRP